jgi:hypothetical protein
MSQITLPLDIEVLIPENDIAHCRVYTYMVLRLKQVLTSLHWCGEKNTEIYSSKVIGQFKENESPLYFYFLVYFCPRLIHVDHQVDVTDLLIFDF